MSTGLDTLHTVRLGRLFRDKRERLGLSLAQVESVTGISTSQINRIENATLQKPSFVDIINLAKFYKVPIDQLVSQSMIQAPEEPVDERKVQLNILCQAIAAQASPDHLDAVIAILQGFLKFLASKQLD